MKIACGTVLFRKYQLEKALDIIRKTGFEYVETQSVGPWCPHVDVEKDDPVAYADKVKAYGFLGTTALWMRHGTLLSSDVCVEWAIRTLEWAKAAGIPVVNTGDGFKPKEMTDEEAFKVFRERIFRILEACERLHTCIAIEPHGTFSLTADGLEKLISVSDSPWLGVNFDGCNIHRAGYVESRGDDYSKVENEAKESETEVLRRVIGRVVHVHMKDYLNGHCVPLGEGDVALDAILDMLKGAGYHGAVSLETEGDESLEVSAEFAAKGLSYLKSRLS